MIIFVLFTAAFVYFDLSYLSKQDKELFKREFHIPMWMLGIYGFFLFVMMFRTAEYVAPVIMLFMLPVYIIKRHRMRTELGKTHPQANPIQQIPFLAIDTFGVVPSWILWMIFLSLVLRLVVMAVPQLDSRLGELVAMTAIAYALMVVLIKRITNRFQDLSFSQAIGLHKNKKSFVTLVVFPALIGLFFACISAAIIHTRTNQPSTPLNGIIESTSSTSVLVIFLAVAVLLAPFFEEIIFRGFFFFVLKKFKGTMFAFLFIALAFGFLHVDQYWGDWAAIGMVGILGFVLTYQRVRLGSCIPGIVTHYMYNGAMTIIPIIMILVSNPSYFEYRINFDSLNFEQKEELLLASIETQPEHADSYNDLAWLYAEADQNLDRALQLIEMALTFNKDQYAYLDTKAEILYKMGRFDEAMAIGTSLVEQYPTDDYLKEQLEKFTQPLEEVVIPITRTPHR